MHEWVNMELRDLMNKKKLLELLDPELIIEAQNQADSEGTNLEDLITEALYIRRQVYVCSDCLFNGHPIAALYKSPDRVCWCSCHKGNPLKGFIGVEKDQREE